MIDKVMMIELIHYEKPHKRTVLTFHREDKNGDWRKREFVNPRLTIIKAISKAVYNARFDVRPFLAGNVGWIAWRPS